MEGGRVVAHEVEGEVSVRKDEEGEEGAVGKRQTNHEGARGADERERQRTFHKGRSR